MKRNMWKRLLAVALAATMMFSESIVSLANDISEEEREEIVVNEDVVDESQNGEKEKTDEISCEEIQENDLTKEQKITEEIEQEKTENFEADEQKNLDDYITKEVMLQALRSSNLSSKGVSLYASEYVSENANALKEYLLSNGTYNESYGRGAYGIEVFNESESTDGQLLYITIRADYIESANVIMFAAF